MDSKYRPRIIDAQISDLLRCMGAIVLEGAKWCGKTTTGEHHANSAIFMDDPKRRRQYQLFAEDNPDAILDGATPRLIDEWQLTPIIWDAIRFRVDHKPGVGQYILSGSAKPADRSEIYHSGSGRFAWMRMRPMSLQESGESSGAVSLSRIFKTSDIQISAESKSNLEKTAFQICRGGWPHSIDLPSDVALTPARQYYNAIVNVDRLTT